MTSHSRRPVLMVTAVLASAWFVLVPTARVNAQASPNTLKIDNRSGDPVHAELIGPSAQAIDLRDGEMRTVNVVPGEYTMQIRYGDDPKAYMYSKVAPFQIEQTSKTYMAATITIECNAPRFPEPVP